jgi:lactate dehydrogenase-like 2-hydroxyacid dehydrogenase
MLLIRTLRDCTGANSAAVAELTWGLILAADRYVLHSHGCCVSWTSICFSEDFCGLYLHSFCVCCSLMSPVYGAHADFSLACREIVAQSLDLKQSKWAKGRYGNTQTHMGLCGRTIGVIGYGR